MFARPARGLLDFCLAVLCIWTAWYHTPAGALARRGTAWALGTRSTARPLLEYYALREPVTVPVPPVLLPESTRPRPERPRSDADALAQGTHLALQALSAEARAPVLALAREQGVPTDVLLDAARGPAAVQRLHARLAPEFPDEESRLFALFAGPIPTRYAVGRLHAEGLTPSLERLARQLPPGFEETAGAAAQALALTTAFALAWPVPDSTRISSPFGYRINPVLGVRKLHTGVDLAVREGSDVRASAEGIVRRASEDGVNGRVLLVDHGRGVMTAYCHNSELLVARGARVGRGQVIARSGNTGRSTGPHLHYQLTLSAQPVDPLRFRSLGTASPPPLVDNAFSE